jgi:hypothetical protein
MKIGQEVEKNLSLDFILSRGEYFYAKLFSLYYGLPFIDSANLIGFYQNGALNMGLSQFQIVKAYEKYGKFVCGGFYGALPNGQIKTFTRGGSDFSGAIVAKALNAQRYLNFTDVDGVFPFAPSIKQSAPIKEISFDKIRLLGEFGATVLHPASVLPLYGEGTEIIVKNTFNQSAIGTVVKERSLSEPFAVGVKENCSYAKLIKRGCGYELHSRFSNCNKIICSVASLDFEEICFEGEFSEEFIQSMGLEFCQLQTGVAIFYLTLCDKTKEIISLLQKQRATVFVSIFESGAYLAVKSENVNKVKEIVYNV